MFGVGIAAKSMINSLKNNSRKKERKNIFEKKDRVFKKVEKEKSTFYDKKPSPELLEKIREETIRERKAEFRRKTLFTIISLIIAILVLIWFVKHNQDYFNKILR